METSEKTEGHRFYVLFLCSVLFSLTGADASG